MNPQNPEPAAGRLRTDSLVDGVLILLAMTVVQRLIGFGRAILFCRWLPMEELGQWDMAFGFLVVAGPLAVLSLPGTFERYAEQFRQRGLLRLLLRRTAVACLALGGISAATIYSARPWFSQLIFGTPERTELVALLTGTLLAVIVYNYFICLVTALRNARLAAVLQLVSSLAFAVLGISLLWLRQNGAESVVAAYGGACLICAAIAGVWLCRIWKALPEEPVAMPRRDLWSKVAPFAVWILAINLLANLFGLIDRYMIIHYSTGSAEESLALVGQYHSSRIVPMLLVSVTSMLAVMLTPHLSHDWESGRRHQVSTRLNLFLKLLAFALSVAAVAVLFAAPLLFDVALGGKFAGGRAVLPWTLAYCSWFGMALVVQKYLWCAEKARLVSLALAIGLGLNIVLNRLLLPTMGLPGAVLATSAANFVTLALIVWLSRLKGFQTDSGTWVAMALPLTVCLGPAVACLVLIVVAWEAVRGSRLLSQQEKAQLAEGLVEYRQRFRGFWPLRKAAGN